MKISTRKPFRVSNSGDIAADLYVELYIYKAVDNTVAGTPPATPQYTIKKQRYNGVSQLLAVDISPFVRDFFEFNAPDPISTEVERVSEDIHYKVDAIVQGVTTTYDCYYGYDEFAESLCASTDVKKSVSIDSSQFLTVDLTGMIEIQWIGSNNTVTVSYSNDTVGNIKELPVVHPSLVLTDITDITVRGYASGGATPNFSRQYTVDCSIYDSYTVAYINRYGVWETFDCVGNSKKGSKGEGEVYRSFQNGANRNFLRNAQSKIRVNTGWVEEDFYDVIVDLILSEDIYLYESGVPRRVQLDTDSIEQIQDKMINYTLGFSDARKQIDII